MASSKVIKTQKDLNEIMKTESNNYYISLNGQVALFNSKYVLTKSEAEDRMFQIASGTSEMIADSMVEENHEDAEDAINMILRTYMVPYRIH